NADVTLAAHCEVPRAPPVAHPHLCNRCPSRSDDACSNPHDPVARTIVRLSATRGRRPGGHHRGVGGVTGRRVHRDPAVRYQPPPPGLRSSLPAVAYRPSGPPGRSLAPRPGQFCLVTKEPLTGPPGIRISSE